LTQTEEKRNGAHISERRETHIGERALYITCHVEIIKRRHAVRIKERSIRHR